LAEATYLLAAGSHEAARRIAEDAVDGYRRAGAPFGAAQARTLLSRILIGLGDWSAARAEAEAAARAFEALGAPADADRARPGSGVRAITPRETDVLRLVADGLTNGEVAVRLVLSEHTVHRHMANAMAKLDVSTRAAAVARATSLGLL
ncbi:MAG: helix-turn-helix transcriptional regulator, partial [Propionicimonas sp.]|nr:helix-turn-helix transcriptional regulator [Propionicimonas sp.]